MNERLDTPHHLRPMLAERLRRAALGLVVALLVARPLVVSENAAEGSGLWFSQLWLGAAVLWAIWQVARGSFVWRFHPIDLAVVVLVLAVAASSLRAAAQRPAINMAWEWAALAAIYFLVRQLPQTAAENRGLASVVLALAVALAGYAIYEYVWTQPRDKADYFAHRERSLRQLGIEPGSAEARRFEDRLLFTHEPIVTFANTNSLAGFVIPWLVLGVGWVAARSQKGKPALPWRGALALSLLVIAVCLFLTKSRAGWAGVLVGLALWLFLNRHRLKARQRIGVVAGLSLLVTAAVALAVLAWDFDQLLVTTAWQAVEYRTQYWRGAWGVIREHPWLGVGPGNFQQHYPAHKLPQSSEEIADPHNLFLELWSTSGIVAAAALAVALAGFFWILWRRARSATRPSETETSDCVVLEPLLLVGGIGGFMLVIALGLFQLIPAEARPSVLTVLFALWLPAVVVAAAALRRTPLPPAAVLAGVVALVVNLLAAGGIAFPAVAQNLWLLAALGLNLSLPPGRRVWHSPLPALPLVALSAVVFALAYLTATGPVTACTAEMNTAAWHLRSHNVRTAIAHLRKAIDQDPLAAAPLQALADVLFEQSRELRATGADPKRQPQLEQQADEKFRAAVRVARLAIERDPYRPSTRWWLGQQFVEHFFATNDPASAEGAAEAFDRCVELYPTNAAYLAASGEALRLVERDREAQARIDRALELLAATPHPDKRIEVLEVFEKSAAHHSQSPVRRAERARALWHDANWFTLDPRQMASKLAEARRVAEAAIRLDHSETRTDSLTPEMRGLLREQIEAR